MSSPSIDKIIANEYENKIYREPMMEDDVSDVSEPYAQERQAKEVDNCTYEAMRGMCECYYHSFYLRCTISLIRMSRPLVFAI